jgi:dolichol kinase
MSQMSTMIVPASEAFALELYRVLRELDPNHLREEIESTMLERVDSLRVALAEVMASVDDGSVEPAMATIRARLFELKREFETHIPHPEFPVAWEEFRTAVVPAYERYAASLRHLDIHVPSLRPTNYARNIFHVSNGLFALGCLLMLTEMQVMMIALGMMSLAWSLEIGRRVVPRLNDFLMKMMGPVAHPHESWRVNSATWYSTACVILASMWDLKVASVGLAVLGFADPAAAIIGRRFGRVQLVNGRTLEGSLTFLAVGTLMTWLWMVVAWSLAAGLAFKMAFMGCLFGCIAELFSRRIDDNLSVPVAAAVGVLVALAFWV